MKLINVDVSLEDVGRVKNSLDPVDPQDLATKAYVDASGGSASIQQLTSDPVSPTAESAWVLATQVATVGSPMGLLLALTNSANRFTYQFRYRTIEGTTVGASLTQEGLFMADNIGVTAGTGTTVAADDIGGVLHQRIKMVIGADGVSNGDVSAANPMPIVDTDVSNSVTASATTNTNMDLNVEGFGGVALDLFGTWTGTVDFQASVDGVNFRPISGTDMILFDGQIPVSTNTAGLFKFDVTGFKTFRAVIAPITGTIQARALASKASGITTGLLAPIFASSKTQDGVGNGIASLDDGNAGKALEVAMAATGFVLSTLNSTTAQLAASATFTGTIETVFNQQAASILLTSDKKGTLTIKQYIDGAGTRMISSVAYSVLPNIPFSRCVTVNGNFFNLTFQNTDTTTTTTLNINTAYGTLPATTNLLNAPMSLDEIAGTQLTNNSVRADALLKVSMEPTSLFYDTFDAALDTTDRWTVAGTAPTSGTGQLTMNQGTAALAFSGIQSKASFQLLGSMFVQPVNVLKVDSGLKTGAYRFFGLGVAEAAPTVANPIVNGVGFEWASATGILSGVVWSNSVRTQSVSLAVFQPQDGNFHRYSMLYKTSRVYFEIDGANIGTIALPNPQLSTLPDLQLVVNGAATVTPAAVMQSSFVGVGDTSQNNSQISDGTFPWRKAKVTDVGALSVVTVDGWKTTYSAAATSIVSAATAQDIFTLTGSATKTIRITRVTVTGTQTTAAQQNILLVRRSTANTGGTSTAVTAVPMDSTNAAATATALAYTANPTAGTLVGALRSRKVFVGATTANSDEFISDFGTRNAQAIVLRGTSQVFAVNLNGVTVTGGNFNVAIEWTEET